MKGKERRKNTKTLRIKIHRAIKSKNIPHDCLRMRKCLNAPGRVKFVYFMPDMNDLVIMYNT